ncbi:hypothetical protein JYT83_01025 [bacterium AH-315-F18]|nr:hypothetical protein [bacterium AH-315-F18]
MKLTLTLIVTALCFFQPTSPKVPPLGNLVIAFAVDERGPKSFDPEEMKVEVPSQHLRHAISKELATAGITIVQPVEGDAPSVSDVTDALKKIAKETPNRTYLIITGKVRMSVTKSPFGGGNKMLALIPELEFRRLEAPEVVYPISPGRLRLKGNAKTKSRAIRSIWGFVPFSKRLLMLLHHKYGGESECQAYFKSLVMEAREEAGNDEEFGVILPEDDTSADEIYFRRMNKELHKNN